MSDIVVSPVTAHLRVGRGATASRVFGIVGLLVVTWCVFLAFGETKSLQNKLTDICVYITMVTMWNLLAGYSGLVSIGQQAYVGLGAYGLIVFANGYSTNIYGSIFIAAAATTVLAIPIGFVAFRLRSGYFAVGTWVLAEVVKLVIKNNNGPTIKGGSGTSLKAPSSLYSPLGRSQMTTFLAIVVAVGAIVGAYLVVRSRLGLALQSIRDNEAGAAGLGVNVYRTRFIVYLIAAFFTSLAAGVHYLQVLRVQPESAFSVGDWIAPIIVMVVLGGLGTIEGPIIGAIIWYLAKVYLTDPSSTVHVSSEVYLIGSGIVALLCALYLETGLWGLVTRRFPQLQLFPVRRRLHGLDTQGDHRGA